MIAIANDHSALEMKKEIMSLLDEMGLEYKDFGAYSSESCNYPVFGARAARAVASGECEFGILLCGTGLGIGLGRRHNNANMLSMGARIIGPELAKCIARAFLTAQFEGGRHALRVEMLSALERGEEIE